MNRCQGRNKGLRLRYGWVPGLCLALALAGCGEGSPRPPSSPPRPMTDAGGITHAHMVLSARPALPKPGMM